MTQWLVRDLIDYTRTTVWIFNARDTVQTKFNPIWSAQGFCFCTQLNVKIKKHPLSLRTVKFNSH